MTLRFALLSSSLLSVVTAAGCGGPRPGGDGSGTCRAACPEAGSLYFVTGSYETDRLSLRALGPSGAQHVLAEVPRKGERNLLPGENNGEYLSELQWAIKPSPDGSIVAWVHDGFLTLVDVASGAQHSVGATQIYATGLSWAGDSQHIGYLSVPGPNDSGSVDIATADGRVLTRLPAQGFVWSPDSSRVAYSTSSSHTSDLHLFDVRSGNNRLVAKSVELCSYADTANALWSSDSRWLGYVIPTLTGTTPRYEFVMASATRDETHVVDNVPYEAYKGFRSLSCGWSPTEPWFLTSTPLRTHIVRPSPTGLDDIPFDGVTYASTNRLAWSPTGSNLVNVALDDIQRLNLHGPEQRVIQVLGGKVSEWTAHPSWIWNPDGDRGAFVADYVVTLPNGTYEVTRKLSLAQATGSSKVIRTLPEKQLSPWLGFNRAGTVLAFAYRAVGDLTKAGWDRVDVVGADETHYAVAPPSVLIKRLGWLNEGAKLAFASDDRLEVVDVVPGANSPAPQPQLVWQGSARERLFDVHFPDRAWRSQL